MKVGNCRAQVSTSNIKQPQRTDSQRVKHSLNATPRQLSATTGKIRFCSDDHHKK